MTPTVPTSAVESAFQNPIVYGLLLLVIVLYLLAEVTGKLAGPLNKLIIRRRNAAVAADGPDLLALERAVAAQEKQQQRSDAHIAELRAEVDELRRDRDAANRLLAAHTRWDRAAQQAFADHGIDLPAPPPLFVYEEPT